SIPRVRARLCQRRHPESSESVPTWRCERPSLRGVGAGDRAGGVSLGGFARSAGRVGAAVQNALEIVRLGGLETDEEPSPFDVVSEQPIYRLRRYFPERASSAPDRPVIVLVPPLMLSAEVWDVSPATSAVARLTEDG